MNKPSTCNHEDCPCCGCESELSHDAADKSVRADKYLDAYLDAAYEDRTEIDFDCGE